MTAKRNRLQIIDNLLVRVSAARGTIFFRSDETALWEHGAKSELIEAGLLKSASDAKFLECQRCTHRCPRPVERLPSKEHDSAPRHVLACEARDDISLIPIEPQQLKRWRSSRALVARFVGQQLGVRILREDYRSGSVQYSAIRVHGLRLKISLEFHNTGSLILVGRHSILLDGLILWHDANPRLERPALIAALGHFEAFTARIPTYQPSRLRQQARKAETAQRNRLWQDTAIELKRQNPRRKKADIADEIFRGQSWLGVTSRATIMRVIRLPRKL